MALHKGRLAEITAFDVGDLVIISTDEKVEHTGKVVFIDVANQQVFLENSYEEGSAGDTEEVEGSVWTNEAGTYLAGTNGKYHVLAAFPSRKVRRHTEWIKELIIENSLCDLPVFSKRDVFNAIVENSLAREIGSILAMILSKLYQAWLERLPKTRSKARPC